MSTQIKICEVTIGDDEVDMMLECVFEVDFSEPGCGDSGISVALMAAYDFTGCDQMVMLTPTNKKSLEDEMHQYLCEVDLSE